MDIKEGDFSHPAIIALLERHLAGMHDHSPACGVHALDLSGLQRPDVTFRALWDSEALMGFGALRELSKTQGEIKSMRTADAHLGKGVGRIILTHLIDLARARGYTRLSLETGSGPAFEAAIHLYKKYGFESGPAFGDYEASDFNQFFHLDLAAQ